MHIPLIVCLTSLVHGFSTPYITTLVSLSSKQSTLKTPLYVATTTNYEEDVSARSSFGTRAYWDDVYQGRGDFPKDEYSWYYGYDVIKPHLQKVAPTTSQPKILLPGIGNDPILLDLYGSGYTNLVAFDYSEHAIERQKDLLSYEGMHSKCSNTIQVYQMDARYLKPSWTNYFDVVLEKGALDAIYLSGDGNVEASVRELDRVLKPGGFVISISGVVPDLLRQTLFSNYSWIRDGTGDLRAGCFVFQKPCAQNVTI